MNRRLVVLAGAGLAAAAIGAGTAWRRARHDAEDAGAPEVSIDIWGLEFKSVDGAPVKMAGWRGRPLLLNFWATWCGPCVVEMPLLDRFARQQSPVGWRVLALAVDQLGINPNTASGLSLRRSIPPGPQSSVAWAASARSCWPAGKRPRDRDKPGSAANWRQSPTFHLESSAFTARAPSDAKPAIRTPRWTCAN